MDYDNSFQKLKMDMDDRMYCYSIQVCIHIYRYVDDIFYLKTKN